MNWTDWYTDTADVFRNEKVTENSLTHMERRQVLSGVACRVYQTKPSGLQMNQTAASITQTDKLACGIEVDIKPGDELVIRIVEEQSSKRVPPVEHPIHIVYEDEDILVIDKQAYDLVIKGKRVDAPPKEIELLYFLASSPNRVFTRAQLLDDVWGFDYFGDTRTVDVHVKRLREKLEGVSDKWGLKTVWGVGYKFETKE